MDEILEYCSMTWGVTFPVFDKVKVNGGKAAPLYKALKKAGMPRATAGRVKWNFEKFVLTPERRVHRFRPNVKPDDPAIVEVIEENLPAPDRDGVSAACSAPDRSRGARPTPGARSARTPRRAARPTRRTCRR